MKINVMIVKPNILPKVTELENDFLEFKNIIDGKVKAVNLGNELAILFNEKGELLGMTPSFMIGYTKIFGPAIFVRDTGETEYKSLTPDQITEAWNIVNEGRYSAYNKRNGIEL